MVNAPASTLKTLNKRAGDSTLIFNAGAKDDALRTGQCHVNLLHTMPSYSMLTDALGQWLNQRRWDEVFLITGPTEADKGWAEAFRRSARRFGLDIVEDKPWTFDADLRRTASKELPLFTQASDYDAVVVADVRGDFGEYVPSIPGCRARWWAPRACHRSPGIGWWRVGGQPSYRTGSASWPIAT